MQASLILATGNGGISRAARTTEGRWEVEFLLADLDVRCLAADPLNPQVLYAGTQGQGVLRSDDRGLTWRQAGMAGQIVKSLAVSPHNPGTVFAGTKPASVFVTRDGGARWDDLDGFARIPGRWWWFSPAEKPTIAYVQAISISPADPDVVLAGIEFGAVVRSQDGGRTWSGHRRGALRDCHNLKFHTRDGDWAYEAGGTGGGASVSQDGGRTWRKTGKGFARRYGVACAADPADPRIWYVSVAPGPWKIGSEHAQAHLYRLDGESVSEPIGWGAPGPMRLMPIALQTLPSAPGHLYAGLTNGEVWHTPDYGDAWEQLPFNLKGIWLSLLVL